MYCLVSPSCWVFQDKAWHCSVLQDPCQSPWKDTCCQLGSCHCDFMLSNVINHSPSSFLGAYQVK